MLVLDHPEAIFLSLSGRLTCSLFGSLPGIEVPGGYFYTQVMGFTILQVRYSECLAGIKDLSEKAQRDNSREEKRERERVGDRAQC